MNVYVQGGVERNKNRVCVQCEERQVCVCVNVK